MGVAQWDYLLPIADWCRGAATRAGTIMVLVAAVLAALLIAPAFALLYTLDQKSLSRRKASTGAGTHDRDRSGVPALMSP